MGNIRFHVHILASLLTKFLLQTSQILCLNFSASSAKTLATAALLFQDTVKSLVPMGPTDRPRRCCRFGSNLRSKASHSLCAGAVPCTRFVKPAASVQHRKVRCAGVHLTHRTLPVSFRNHSLKISVSPLQPKSSGYLQ